MTNVQSQRHMHIQSVWNYAGPSHIPVVFLESLQFSPRFFKPRRSGGWIQEIISGVKKNSKESSKECPP